MNTRTPKISVIMPVYNSERYARAAVESVLSQTFTDFEFIIINDGSTDGTKRILGSFHDPRIRIITNDANRGMAFNFNRGLELAQGEYIARMDADDISLPRRFATQLAFLEKNPDIGIAGSWVKTFGRGAERVARYFTEPEDIRASLLFNTSLAHPSVMMRRKTVLEHYLRYDPACNPADDYDLWVRAAEFTQFANIPKVLFQYRLHENNITNTRADERRMHARNIQRRQLKKLGLEPTEEEMDIHNGGAAETGVLLVWLQKTEQWFLKIHTANELLKVYEQKALCRVLGSRWHVAAYTASAGGISIWRRFARSPLRHRSGARDTLREAKLFLCCLKGNSR